MQVIVLDGILYTIERYTGPKTPLPAAYLMMGPTGTWELIRNMKPPHVLFAIHKTTKRQGKWRFSDKSGEVVCLDKTY